MVATINRAQFQSIFVFCSSDNRLSSINHLLIRKHLVVSTAIYLEDSDSFTPATAHFGPDVLTRIMWCQHAQAAKC